MRHLSDTEKSRRNEIAAQADDKALDRDLGDGGSAVSPLYEQPGRIGGKDVWWRLSAQQFAEPERSQIKSLAGSGEILGSGLRPLSSVRFCVILTSSGSGFKRGSSTAKAGGS